MAKTLEISREVIIHAPIKKILKRLKKGKKVSLTLENLSGLSDVTVSFKTLESGVLKASVKDGTLGANGTFEEIIDPEGLEMFINKLYGTNDFFEVMYV